MTEEKVLPMPKPRSRKGVPQPTALEALQDLEGSIADLSDMCYATELAVEHIYEKRVPSKGGYYMPILTERQYTGASFAIFALCQKVRDVCEEYYKSLEGCKEG